MGYNKLFELLKDDIKLKSFVSNLSGGNMEVPYIMTKTFELLEDDSVMFNHISDSNKVALCKMLDMYFNDCFYIYIEDVAFDKLLNYGCIEVYKIDAANGLRYATVNEVAQGVRGLIGEKVYPAGEKEYQYLCLLYWTFVGKPYYFRQAGYKLEYDDNGKVITSFYEMIQMCAQQLKDMFDWISVRNDYESAIKKIQKMKKNKGYKYATFEKDEIVEDITIKQLIYNVYKVFPRNSDNIEYRRALALAIKNYKNHVQLSPLEISSLRDIYEKHALDRNAGKEQNVDEDLKNKCEVILREKYSGKIKSNHFAYTIIDTLRKSNYTKCSMKQHAIIDDAYSIVAREHNEVEDEKITRTEVISDNDIDSSLETLSNAIGHGLFDDESEEV